MYQRLFLDIRTRQLTLPAHPAAVPRVRRWASQALTEWGLDGLSDTTLLLASELATNAVRHPHTALRHRSIQDGERK
jgi:anti-sigma regulatory factor (Ser/Thr protein kinase)